MVWKGGSRQQRLEEWPLWVFLASFPAFHRQPHPFERPSCASSSPSLPQRYNHAQLSISCNCVPPLRHTRGLAVGAPNWTKVMKDNEGFASLGGGGSLPQVWDGLACMVPPGGEGFMLLSAEHPVKSQQAAGGE